MSAFGLLGESGPSIIRVKMNEKRR